MRTAVSEDGENSGKQAVIRKVKLDALAILKYFLGLDEKLDTLITCKADDAEITATDLELYQALGSLKAYDSIQHSRLVKFLENVDIVSFRSLTGSSKGILTHEKVEELRKLALMKKDIGGK